MTTFTRISEEDQPSISTSPDHTISKIDQLLYGGFAEHIGRCIYGGVYDPGNKNGRIDENGFRADIIDCMKELKRSTRQVEQASKEDYAKKAYQWGKALKQLDPTIKLVLCGKDGHSDWDRYVLQECVKVTDLHSIHIYTFDMDHYSNATSPKAAERAIEITVALIDLARSKMDYETFPHFVTKPRTLHRPKISFDEWNIWNPIRAPGNKGAEELYDVSDMTAVALWLNQFVRQARHTGMATITQSVNVIAPLMTNEHGVVKQTTYWPLLLFSTYMRGRSVAAHVRSPVYTGRTVPEWLATTMDIPILDVSAAVSDDDCLNLAVVNVSESKSQEVSLPPIEGPVQVFVVGGDENDIRETNTRGSQKVRIKESTWNGKGKLVFQEHSFILLRWKVISSRSRIEEVGVTVDGISATVHNALHGV